MFSGTEVKVCGITRRGDAQDALEVGADLLGFNFYPESPRCVSLDLAKELAADLPESRKVAVVVLPDSSLLETLCGHGFGIIQIHYAQAATDIERLEQWSTLVGPEKLWLAPRRAPGESLDERALSLADTWLWDAFKADAFGGTGRTSDWAGFKSMRERFPDKNWVLAGGLGPDNIRDAVTETGTTRIDLNSGIEISPGMKDRNRLERVKSELGALRAD